MIIKEPTTVKVSKATRDRLKGLKEEKGFRSTEEAIEWLLNRTSR